MAINYHELRLMRRNGEFDTIQRSCKKHFGIWLWLICVLMAFIATCSPARANACINDNQAILAIIGEGENQGYQGMLALASAIRNRGTLKGVYGLNAPRVKAHKYSLATYNMAKKAWLASANTDITKGATHWENINAFGKPYWVKSMVETFRYKDHVFYKERG